MTTATPHNRGARSAANTGGMKKSPSATNLECQSCKGLPIMNLQMDLRVCGL
jgi:hypothetical protein